MPFTVLFDLDDTLLVNEMGVHLPAYFKTFQDHLAAVMPAEHLMASFLEAGQVMLGGEHFEQPLLDVFFEHFCSATGVAREAIEPVAQSYYLTAYDALKQMTATRPGAQDLVGKFDRRGYTMVVATNPLLPRVAAERRILWAELPIDIGRFRMVTASEIFHFAKPNPAYYAELMGYLGWPEGPVVMIGNDVLNDRQAAAKLGIPTYLVTGNGKPQAEDVIGGPIEQAVDWIDSRDPADFLPSYRSPEAVLAIYKSTLAVIDSYVRACDESDWSYRPKGEWTPAEVLYHLCDVEEKVNLPRVRELVKENNPFIPGVDTDACYANGFPPIRAPRMMLDRFVETRKETIRLLSGLEPDGWQRTARHAIFGPTDILEITYIMARHDQLHIRQLGESLSIR